MSVSDIETVRKYYLTLYAIQNVARFVFKFYSVNIYIFIKLLLNITSIYYKNKDGLKKLKVPYSNVLCRYIYIYIYI